MFGLSQNRIDHGDTMKHDPDGEAGVSVAQPAVPSFAPDAALDHASSDHSVHSSLREKLIEHLFVGGLLSCLWRSGCRDVEVLRSEVDAGGFDLVIDCKGVLRHIQLKASVKGASTSSVNVNTRLARKPGGCVLWLWFDEETLEIGPLLWFGGEAGMPLPDLGEKIARHTRANSNGMKLDRPGIRTLAKGQFTALQSFEEVAARLFGVSS